MKTACPCFFCISGFAFSLSQSVTLSDIGCTNGLLSWKTSHHFTHSFEQSRPLSDELTDCVRNERQVDLVHSPPWSRLPASTICASISEQQMMNSVSEKGPDKKDMLSVVGCTDRPCSVRHWSRFALLLTYTSAAFLPRKLDPRTGSSYLPGNFLRAHDLTERLHPPC